LNGDEERCDDDCVTGVGCAQIKKIQSGLNFFDVQDAASKYRQYPTQRQQQKEEHGWQLHP